MGELIEITEGLSPIQGLSVSEYRRLANILLLQYDATEFEVKAIGRLGNKISIEVKMTNPNEKVVVRL